MTLVASPKGPWFASGSLDSTIIVWDSRSGTVVYDWAAHERFVWSLAFSPDGRHLCSTGSDDTPKVWDLGADTATLVTTLVGHMRPVRCCAWSSSGALLATGSNDGSVRVWDGILARRGICHEIPGLVNAQCFGTSVSTVQFSPDASWLFAIHRLRASLANDGAAAYPGFNLWHFAAGFRVVQKHFGWVAPITAAAFDPRGRRLATISVHVESMCLWDLETESKLTVIPFSNTRPSALDEAIGIAFSSDGSSILTLRPTPEAPRKLELWDTESGRSKVVFGGRDHWSPCFSPDGNYIAAGSSFPGGVHLWRTNDGSHETVPMEGEDVNHFAFTADGHKLAYTSDTPIAHGSVMFVDCSPTAHRNSGTIH